MLREKEILNDNELDLIKMIHNNLRIRLGSCMMGDVRQTLGELARAVDHKANCRRAGLIPDRVYLSSLKAAPIKGKIPRRITRLIQIMYGKLCADHKKPLNRTHLAVDHHITVDPVALIRAYS